MKAIIRSIRTAVNDSPLSKHGGRERSASTPIGTQASYSERHNLTGIWMMALPTCALSRYLQAHRRLHRPHRLRPADSSGRSGITRGPPPTGHEASPPNQSAVQALGGHPQGKSPLLPLLVATGTSGTKPGPRATTVPSNGGSHVSSAETSPAANLVPSWAPTEDRRWV